MNKVLIICGPTATGKTRLGLHLAKKFSGEIVSADSRQVYKGMDIGTGKDLPLNSKIQKTNNKVKINKKIYYLNYYLLDGVNLWLYDLVYPDEEFSVSHYQKLAHYIIDDICSRDKLPIIVGGTGLYIKSITDYISTINIGQNKSLRKSLENKSIELLQGLLKIEDDKVWDNLNKSDRNNPRRLIRKIEIAKYRNKEGEKDSLRKGNKYDFLSLGLIAGKKYLYKRIDARVEKRVQEGIIDEISCLLKKGYSWVLPSMSALGYSQLKEYFENNTKDKYLKDKIIQQWKSDEHNYAKRQLTWFRKDNRIIWFDISEESYKTQVDERVRQWYTDK
jgi:tRNA dimethylallyltransferase